MHIYIYEFISIFLYIYIYIYVFFIFFYKYFGIFSCTHIYIYNEIMLFCFGVYVRCPPFPVTSTLTWCKKLRVGSLKVIVELLVVRRVRYSLKNKEYF